MYWTERNPIRELLTKNLLVTSLIISLLIHVLSYELYRTGFLTFRPARAAATPKKKPMAQAQPPQANDQQQPRQIPMTFVEVDRTAAVEPPKDAKYYGAANAKATNPDASLDTTIPKVDGSQKEFVRLEPVKPQPLQPSISPEELKAKPKPDPGNLTKLTPDQILKPNTGTSAKDGTGEKAVMTRERPRTLADARAQRNLVGEPIKQEGGVKRPGKIAFDVKATSFGVYDALFIEAVQQRWYDLIDSTQSAQRSGKVVLEFRLYYDGRIAEMQENGNEVGELLGLLCQRAVLDPAPFPRWPSDMRREISRDFREIKFTFYYN